MYAGGRDRSIGVRAAGVRMLQRQQRSNKEDVMAKQVIVYSQPG